jgi:Zn-dependent protease with chaperone function
MDFFTRQDQARSKTRGLVVLFVLAVAGITATIYLVAVLLFGGGFWQPELLGGVILLVLAVVGVGSVFKIMQLSQGGTAVASMLGGVPVDLHTQDPQLRQLLNIVEEMSIASGVPVPSVYVLQEDAAINAFAAGHTAGDAVIGVTRGAIERLTRDEMQGVIAHEFSHILNGDMRLNIRLMGGLFGILCLALLGQILLRSSLYMRPRSGDRNGGGVAFFVVGGIALITIGYIGVLFANLIKAAVSRQREFLADAAAVQFTRNPDGIAGALHKIGRLSGKLQSAHATEASHMFFGNGVREPWLGLLATHPPIEKRIRAVAPHFDPNNVRTVRPPDPPLPDGKAAPVRRSWLGHAGQPDAGHLVAAAALLSELPRRSAAAAHELHGATALIYALLFAEDTALQEKQWQSLQVDDATRSETAKRLQERAELSHEQQITLIDLAIPTLRQLSPDQYEVFRRNVEAMISADEKIDLFEFLLEKILVRHLDHHFTKKTGTPVQFRGVLPLLPDVAVLLGALAQLGSKEETEREAAYAAGVRELLVNSADPALARPTEIDLSRVSSALDRLAAAAPNVKRQVLTAAGSTVMADENVAVGQAQLLRAMADAIDCPVPPFVQAAKS